MPRRDTYPRRLPVGAWILLPVLSVLVAGMVVGCGRGGDAHAAQQAQNQERPPTPVTVAHAITRDVPVYLEAIGRTVAVEQVSIVPQVGGKVVAAHVGDGADVTRGQLLFEIDPRPFEATLASARATLAQAEAELAWSAADYQRTQELRASNVVSQLEYEQKKSQYLANEARVQAARAAVDLARLNLEYTKIYSPIDGRAGARLVDPGNIVRANEQTMLVIQRLDPIYAEFTVTENDLGTVRKFLASRGFPTGEEDRMGLKAQVDVPGDSQPVLAALGATPVSTRPTTAPGAGPRVGTVSFLDNTVNSGTGTIKVRATVPNADYYFWPGQFVNVRLILTVRKNAVLIPAQAQQIGQAGPFVYVVTPQSTAELRPIVPGQRHGDLIVVERGLDPDERVIVTGQMLVSPQGRVTVTNEPPPQQTASAAMSPDRTQVANE
ncbi:efflux RND transporter periplasmic adaptor subunit [Fontivita pretiosa]|uniref:efflux RND transporter periplasmic adaptor subunit n=1 Tax=Fontivita pretiosa TaxID=2989684 RepID=UPI003D181732